MSIFEAMGQYGHEQILFNRDEAAGYTAVIAIHSTVLGPAFGGTRLWAYADEKSALVDVLRLSRGMTYKNAAAGIPFGGGKTVILDRRAADRVALFRAHGHFVERLAGRYVTAQDVGTTLADLEVVRGVTRHVAGLGGRVPGGVSPWTGRGVFGAIRAAARERWGNDGLGGRTIAVQGCGAVGTYLLRHLHGAGAKLVVTDVDASRAAQAASELGAKVVAPEAILSEPADVLAPCALGGILNDESIPRLRAEIVVGGANNQLLEPRHGRMLADRGILYGPDFVVNAGGVISGCIELLGWSEAQMHAKVDAIHDTLSEVFAIAKRDRILTEEAAERLAERRIAAGRVDA